MTLGDTFLARVLREAADTDGINDNFNIQLDSQTRSLAAKMRLPLEKRLVAFHFMCGVPGRYLNSEDVVASISDAADMLRKRVSVRRAFSTLYEALATAKGLTLPATNGAVKEEKRTRDVVEGEIEELSKKIIQLGKDGARGSLIAPLEKKVAQLRRELELVKEGLVHEAVRKRGSFMQKLLETVMTKLGLPDALTSSSGPSAVGTGLYRTAKLIEEDAGLERALRMLATRLGVKPSDAAAPVEDDASVKEDVALDEVMNLGAHDEYAEAVLALVAALGIPDTVLASRRSQLIQGLRQKKQSLRNRAQVMLAMERLVSIVERNTVQRGEKPEQGSPGAAPAQGTGTAVEAASRWKHLSGLRLTEVTGDKSFDDKMHKMIHGASKISSNDVRASLKPDVEAELKHDTADAAKKDSEWVNFVCDWCDENLNDYDLDDFDDAADLVDAANNDLWKKINSTSKLKTQAAAMKLTRDNSYDIIYHEADNRDLI